MIPVDARADKKNVVFPFGVFGPRQCGQPVGPIPADAISRILAVFKEPNQPVDNRHRDKVQI
jgi:hypothetical protein